MKTTKLHLLPALLLIATVKLDIVASVQQLNWAQFESLKGQLTTSTCPPLQTDTEISTTGPEEPEPEPTSTDSDLSTSDYSSLDPTSSLLSTAPRSNDLDFDSLPVNSIGSNAELDSARNRQTIRIQRLPARRGSQRRRRRTNRKRPSAEKRRRRNRHNSKDRLRRHRRGQRKGQRIGPRQEVRRVFVRRHYSNKRNNGENTAKPEQSQ